jgi:hypothetical protein
MRNAIDDGKGKTNIENIDVQKGRSNRNPSFVHQPNV